MKKMRIKELLESTGFTREHFNGLKRDGNTPSYFAKNDQVTGWAEYTVDQAFELRLLGELIGKSAPIPNAGLLAGFACKVVGNSLAEAHRKNERRDPWFFAGQALPIFLGFGEFKVETADGTIRHDAAWFCDSTDKLPEWIVAKTSGYCGGEVPTLTRVLLVNATDAARHVLKKAVALGLIEPGRATE